MIGVDFFMADYKVNIGSSLGRVIPGLLGDKIGPYDIDISSLNLESI